MINIHSRRQQIWITAKKTPKNMRNFLDIAVFFRKVWSSCARISLPNCIHPTTCRFVWDQNSPKQYCFQKVVYILKVVDVLKARAKSYGACARNCPNILGNTYFYAFFHEIFFNKVEVILFSPQKTKKVDKKVKNY